MGKHFKDVYNHLANWMKNVAEQDEMHRGKESTCLRLHMVSFLELREVYVWSMKLPYTQYQSSNYRFACKIV